MSITKKDWTLLTISCAEGDYISPAQLQKSLFLLSKMKPQAVNTDYYNFIPYNYGPFSQEIYSDIDELVNEGLVITGHPEGERWLGYAITSKGSEYARSLREKATDEDYNYLYRVVNWARNVSFQELIRTIYHRFPEFKANSVFQE